MVGKKSKGLLVCLLLSGLALKAQATSPHWRYQVLRSLHFELVYRDTQKPLAVRYLIAAERAYDLLIPIFKEGPAKTIIFLSDDTDLSNGEANFLPYPHITVYPVLPNTLDSIDEYGDWPFEMILHEYTHILNMYPAHGIYLPLKWMFGSVVRPNAVLPKWYLEGLAVDLESLLSDHGRLRSTETAASARALLLENRLDKEDLARANQSDLTTWPFGSRPYVFGGWWWEDVSREKGSPVIERWNQNFSRRLPFFLNGPMIEATGKSANEWMTASIARLTVQAQHEIDQVKASSPPTAKIVANEQGEQTVFAISPSGRRLIYWIGSTSQGSQVKVKIRSSGDEAFKGIEGLKLFKTIGTLRVRWIDEDRVVFDQLDIESPYVSFRDLYVYDFKTNQVQRLTHGARAQEPGVSPTGEEIAYIQNDGGRNHLNLLNLKTLKTQALINGSLNQRLSGPEFLNHEQILFSLRQKNGDEEIFSYDRGTRKATPWTETLNAAQNLRRIASGFLVNDATHSIRNTYWIHDGKIEPVSNTLTDIETADFDPVRNELVVSELTASGRRLHAYPFKLETPPVLQASTLPAPPRVPAGPSAKDFKDESYQPLSYMWPRYWIPFAYQVDGGLVFQGLTSNTDPAERNSYSLVGSYDTVTNRGSYGGSFVNRSLSTAIGLSYGKAETYLGASGITLESQSAGVNFTNTWPFNSRDYEWNLGGLWLETSSTVRSYRRLGPTLSWQYSGLSNPLNQWYGFSAELSHQEFLSQPGYLAYGRSYLNVGQQLQLGGGHRLLLQTRGSLAPRLPLQKVLVLGEPNVGANYAVNLTNSSFLLRGYPSGEFIGRKVMDANLEYSLPVFPIERGFGTFPLYIQNLELAVFADTMAVDGAAFDSELNQYVARTLGEFSSSAGSELRLKTTAAYHMPLSFTLGLYYGFDSRFGGGFSPFFGIGLGDLRGLQDKTP